MRQQEYDSRRNFHRPYDGDNDRRRQYQGKIPSYGPQGDRYQNRHKYGRDFPQKLGYYSQSPGKVAKRISCGRWGNGKQAGPAAVAPPSTYQLPSETHTKDKEHDISAFLRDSKYESNGFNDANKPMNDGMDWLAGDDTRNHPPPKDSISQSILDWNEFIKQSETFRGTSSSQSEPPFSASHDVYENQTYRPTDTGGDVIIENTNLIYPSENDEPIWATRLRGRLDRIEVTLFDRQAWNHELETTISNALGCRFRALEEQAKAYLQHEMQWEDVKEEDRSHHVWHDAGRDGRQGGRGPWNKRARWANQ